MNRKQLRKLLETNGWELVRGKRHFVFKHPKRTDSIIMPNHNRLDKHTVKGILKKVGNQ